MARDVPISDTTTSTPHGIASSAAPPTERQPTRILYTLNRWDLFCFQLYATRHSRFLILLAIVGLIIIVYPILTQAIEGPYATTARIITVVLYAVVYAFFVAMVSLAVILSHVLFKRKIGLLCEHELELNDQGILERTEANESLSRWSSFHRIAVTAHYVLLYVSDTHVHAIPRRSFGSDAAFKSFVAEVRDRASGARQHESSQ